MMKKCLSRLLVLGTTVLPGLLGLGAMAAEPAGQPGGDWWCKPAAVSRHTSFVASFDAKDSNDADFARGNPQAGGFGMEANVPGKFGRGIMLGEKGAHLHFLGPRNFNPHRGTLRFFFKDLKPGGNEARWLFEAAGDYLIGVRYKAGTFSFIARKNRDAHDQFFSEIALKTGPPPAGQWHSVLASWDLDTGRGMLAVDERVQHGPFRFPTRRNRQITFYLGGGLGARVPGGMNEAGLCFDDLAIYDLPLSALQADRTPLPVRDSRLLARSEDAVRKSLFFMAKLQNSGGWQNIYSWPTLVPSATQWRDWVTMSGDISNEKSHASPYFGGLYLYAYEVLGDYDYFETAMRTADLLVAVQDPGGYWAKEYKVTLQGVKPYASDKRHVMFQDSVQSHPIFFLAYLHRLTGDRRYRDALERAGAFYLKAQNPNGSWPHHYDAVSNVGRTHTNKPRGGEINDLATNDAIDIMVLMYHLTQDPKYVNALKRVGQWLIDAQLKGATRGWALQYDEHNRPIAARDFEPAACSGTASLLAAEALVEIYRLSSDERYLAPIRACIEWIESRSPDGTMWEVLDPTSGRPIATWAGKRYELDDPAQLKQARETPTNQGYLRKRPIIADLKALLQKAQTNPIPRIAADGLGARSDTLRGPAETALDRQNESGVWVERRMANAPPSLGGAISCRILQSHWRKLLQYIDTVRMATGELPVRWRGDGYLRHMAYPNADWYDVGWQTGKKPDNKAANEGIAKGRLLYKTTLADPASVNGWRMEGPGKVAFKDGWMHMFSPEKKMHHVYWCPKTFPSSFVAEWEAQNLDPAAGLCIVFFAAKGVGGEDIFDPKLPGRDGTFEQYTRGKIGSYHISYYANAAHNPGRGHANLRKNNRFALVQEGEVGIPADSVKPHKLRLVKDGPRIVMFVDDRKIIDWTDDGKTHGPPHTDGKIGFRQMQWTRFRYRNFRVWEIGRERKSNDRAVRGEHDG
jgi:PelA/Pel-15E family pectate lyase